MSGLAITQNHTAGQICRNARPDTSFTAVAAANRSAGECQPQPKRAAAMLRVIAASCVIPEAEACE